MSTLKDLKKTAKVLKIKGGYKMDKAQLIEAISLAEVEAKTKELEKETPVIKTDETSKPVQPTVAEKAGFSIMRAILAIVGFVVGIVVTIGSFIGVGIVGFFTSRKVRYACGTIVLIVGGFWLHYLTRPEPTFWEKLMGYMPW